MQAAEEQFGGVHRAVDYAATGLESLAIAIIVIATFVATFSYLVTFLKGHSDRSTYDSYRRRIGRAMLLGLEILVAADVVRTVVLEPTLTNVVVLGLLILIRTFLSWSLVLEMEERWPWQRGGENKG